MGFGMCLGRGGVHRVGHRQDPEAEGSLGVQVPRDLPRLHPNLADHLLLEPSPLGGVLRAVEALQAGRARPLAVDGQQASAGQAQGIFHAPVPEGGIALEHVGGELRQRPGQDVFSGRSTAAGAGHDRRRSLPGSPPPPGPGPARMPRALAAAPGGARAGPEPRGPGPGRPGTTRRGKRCRRRRPGPRSCRQVWRGGAPGRVRPIRDPPRAPRP